MLHLHRKATCEECKEFGTPFLESLRRAWKMLIGDDGLDDLPWYVVRPTPSMQRRTHERIEKRIDTEAVEAGRWTKVRTEREVRRVTWSFLCTLLDPVDRAFCAPPRLHINTPWGHLTIAIGPYGRVGQWNRRAGDYVGKWIDFRPRHFCNNVVALEKTGNSVFDLFSSFRTCTLRRGHRGNCNDWKRGRVAKPLIEIAP